MPVVFKNKSFNPAANPADIFDSGEATADSIKPVKDGDNVNQDTFRRPSENLRLRTEELKRNVNKYETILQSAGFLSYSYNEAVDPLTVRDSTVEVKWDAADGSFYVLPSQNAVLTILGAVVPGMKYAIDRSAFVSFYGSNVLNGYNPKLGLFSPGDSINFRLPLLSTEDAASNPLDLIGANTSNQSIESATLANGLFALVNNPISGADGDRALFKSPSKYKLKITLDAGANGAALKTALEGAVANNHNVELDITGQTYTLDASSFLVSEDNPLEVFILEDNRAYFPFDAVGDGESILVNNIPYEGPGADANTSWNSIDVLEEGPPPEEFLIPVASYTGTKIIVHGIGSIDADDVKNAEGTTVTLSNTGVASTELGGAIESYESTFRLTNVNINASTISNELEFPLNDGLYSTLTIPISLDIPEIPTGREYYLDSIEIYSGATNVFAPVSIHSIDLYRSKDGVSGSGDLLSDFLGVNLLTAEPGDIESIDLQSNPSRVDAGFYLSNQSRSYSATPASSDNLVIGTEEDRERTFLRVILAVDNGSYTVLTASFDLFFRLTFKTVHGNELPLLASYVPASS